MNRDFPLTSPCATQDRGVVRYNLELFGNSTQTAESEAQNHVVHGEVGIRHEGLGAPCLVRRGATGALTVGSKCCAWARVNAQSANSHCAPWVQRSV